LVFQSQKRRAGRRAAADIPSLFSSICFLGVWIRVAEQRAEAQDEMKKEKIIE
jgi:hypothetical protein